MAEWIKIATDLQIIGLGTITGLLISGTLYLTFRLIGKRLERANKHR